jgi:hypothetical protein
MSESIVTGGWWGLILFAVFCVLVMRWLRGGGTSGRASADGHGDGGYYLMHTSTDSAGGSNGDSCGDGGGSDGGGCDGGGGGGGGD